jgi:hypothetical protein
MKVDYFVRVRLLLKAGINSDICCTLYHQVVGVEHLVAAANEFFRTVEDEENINDTNNISLATSPFLLVSYCVQDDWEVPDEFVNDHAVRFMLMPGDTIDSSFCFLSCLAGPKHGSFDALITRDIDKWFYSNGLSDTIRRIGTAGLRYQPVKAFGPWQKFGDWLRPDLDADVRLRKARFTRWWLKWNIPTVMERPSGELGFWR